MSTEVRQSSSQAYEKEVGAGGEEIVREVEKGVYVRKTGGVEFVPSLSQAEIDSRKADIQSQIDYQHTIISRAKTEAAAASRQANEQEIMAREALEFKEFNRKRQEEAAADVKSLVVEVAALMEKEKELERQRTAAHHAAVDKERERVEAKTAEVLAREEALESEKREHYHRDMVRKCQALNLKFRLEEDQARIKLEQLQFSLTHGEMRPLSAANRAKIVVEVAPRDIPEARQFDTSQVETTHAYVVIGEEGALAKSETRTTEEIVISERKQHRSGSYSSSKGHLKEEEGYGVAEGEGLAEQLQQQQHKELRSESSTVPQEPLDTSKRYASSSSDIKVLPDIKPGSNEPYLGQSGPHQAAQSGAAAAAPRESSPSLSESKQIPSSSKEGGAAPAPTEATTEKKKQKSGFFGKKFGKSKHESSGH